jgi:hypothetical protein
LNVHYPYHLEIFGEGPAPVTNSSGMPLGGTSAAAAGRDDTLRIDFRTLVFTGSRPSSAHVAVNHTDAKAIIRPNSLPPLPRGPLAHGSKSLR